MSTLHQKTILPSPSNPTQKPYLHSITFWALLLLMIVTRYHQQYLSIPDATLAVFFAIGFYFRTYWTVPILLTVAAAVDIIAIVLGGVSAACLSIAYVMLIPAYTSGWIGGRLAYRLSYCNIPIIAKFFALIVCTLSTALVCEIFASGSFYWWSGVFSNPTFEGLMGRLIMYFPATLAYFIGYIILFTTIHTVHSLSQKSAWKIFKKHA